MKKKKKCHFVSVSKLTYLLLKPETYGKLPPRWALERGRLLHWKMGFDNTRKFSRFYEYDDENLFLISGIPDKIDYENGFVEELKTYNGTDRENAHDIGLCQLVLYSYITGLHKVRLHLYNVKDKSMESLEYRVTDEQMEKIVRTTCTKYLLLVKSLDEILKKDEKSSNYIT